MPSESVEPPVENKATFFARLEPALAPSELAKVRAAYYLAKYGHRAQVRKGETDGEGEPLRYFEHPRRVALILMDEANIFDHELIIVALLHDALEDTQDIDGAIVEALFGVRCARLIRLLTKDPKEGYLDRLKGSSDALLIKLCDRIDNLRSLEGSDPAFIDKQVRETQQFHMPVFRSRIPSQFSGLVENAGRLCYGLRTLAEDKGKRAG